MSYIKAIVGKHIWNIHKVYSENLDKIKLWNQNDWDFKILISGDGQTRTGKTTLAMQTATYLDPTFADNWKERVIFDGNQLVKIAYQIGKNKAIVYDEAREGLDSKRQMEQYTKKLLDFFSQCGALNQFIIIVLPEYFELPKSIALTQSIFLANCYARKGRHRGYFQFFNRKDKKYLFIRGQKYLDYHAQRATFEGTFINYIPFDRVEYERLKRVALNEQKEKAKKKDAYVWAQKHKARCKLLIQKLQSLDYKLKPIAEIIGVSVSDVQNTYLRERR